MKIVDGRAYYEGDLTKRQVVMITIDYPGREDDAEKVIALWEVGLHQTGEHAGAILCAEIAPIEHDGVTYYPTHVSGNHPTPNYEMKIQCRAEDIDARARLEKQFCLTIEQRKV